jgi:hypothetical protein
MTGLDTHGRRILIVVLSIVAIGVCGALAAAMAQAPASSPSSSPASPAYAPDTPRERRVETYAKDEIVIRKEQERDPPDRRAGCHPAPA